MKIEYHMGPHNETVELPDTLTEDQIQEYFETWLWNRPDIGWSLVEGKFSDE